VTLTRMFVLSNSRGPESLADLIASLGLQAKTGTVAEAARTPIVLLAVPWIKVREVLTPLRDWDGRILIDATNIFLNYAAIFDVDDLDEMTGSEIVARLAPDARVVKAFNTLPMETMFAEPSVPNARRALFLAGDHEPVYAKDFDLGGVRRALSEASRERKPEWRATSNSPRSFEKF
jgi:8-hydroxy-5-deazaflavin:NADPH oxidoreductase